jgi:hypothetical protein
MNASRLIAGGAYYFSLDGKVTKDQDIGNASFCRTGLCPANRAEPQGRNPVAPAVACKNPAFLQ